MKFLFFLSYIVAVLTCGSVIVGPFSLRVYMTVLMVLFLLVNGNKKTQLNINKKYIVLYLICIFALFLSLFANGGLQEFGFFNRCLAFYLVCIVSYLAVDYFVKEQSQLHMIIFVFSFIIVFDSVASILQFQNNPIGWGIGLFFSDASGIEEYATFMDSHDSLVGVSKLTGIFGHPVSNGFMLAVLTPTLMAGVSENSLIWKKLYFLIVILLAIVTSLLLQQRAAFFLLIIVIAYHLLRDFTNNPARILGVVFIFFIALVLVAPFMAEFMESSRFLDTDNSSRQSVWQGGLEVFKQNILFGDIIQYNKRSELSAHNLFVSCLAYSGLIGFIPFMLLYCKTILDSLRLMFLGDTFTRVFSYSVLISMGMGLFHNTSYFTGEAIIFIVLALMFKSKIISQRKNVGSTR